MSEITGWYYLHTNGELIYKASPDAIVDIRESDFAVAAWPVDLSSRLDAWCILIEASAMGVSKNRINKLAEAWGCDDADAVQFAKYAGVKVFEYSGQWAATRLDFVNEQSSPIGYGTTKLDALSSLAKVLGVTGGSVWRPTFLDLIKVD